MIYRVTTVCPRSDCCQHEVRPWQFGTGAGPCHSALCLHTLALLPHRRQAWLFTQVLPFNTETQVPSPAASLHLSRQVVAVHVHAVRRRVRRSSAAHFYPVQ